MRKFADSFGWSFNKVTFRDDYLAGLLSHKLTKDLIIRIDCQNKIRVRRPHLWTYDLIARCIKLRPQERKSKMEMQFDGTLFSELMILHLVTYFVTGGDKCNFFGESLILLACKAQCRSTSTPHRGPSPTGLHGMPRQLAKLSLDWRGEEPDRGPILMPKICFFEIFFKIFFEIFFKSLFDICTVKKGLT